MAKNFPNLAIGYGPAIGVISQPGSPVGPVPGTQGSALAQSVRQSKGWGK